VTVQTSRFGWNEHLGIAAPSLVAEQDSFVLNMIRIELEKPDDEDRTD
jgi:hypothetical protein